MKKLLLLLATVGMIFTACEPANGLDDDNNGNNGDNTEQPGGGNDDAIPTDKIVIKPSTITVEAAANNYIVAVSSPCSWRANTEEDWITLETELGIDGKQQLIFAVKDYWETEPREGKIVVSNSDEGFSAELTVEQKAFVPEWSVEPTTLNFAVEGGTQEVAVTSNFNYYEVTTTADWVKYTKTGNGITVNIPNYTEVENRTADITLSSEKYNLSKVIKVTQTAFVPELEITTTTISYEYDYKGGEFAIAVTSNFNYDVTTTADWVKCNKDTEGVKISVSVYDFAGNRTAEVKIYSEKYNLEGKTITITQTPPSYPIGTLVTKNGATGVVFYTTDSRVKIVSVEETSASLDDANTWCSSYGEGWYLPTGNEWNAIYDMRTIINATLEANGYTTLAPLYYWAAKDSRYFNTFNFENGGLYSYSYDYDMNIRKYCVRAVLAFEN